MCQTCYFFNLPQCICNQTIRLINEQDVINTKQVYEGSFENFINEHAIDVEENEFRKEIINNSIFTTLFRRI